MTHRVNTADAQSIKCRPAYRPVNAVTQKDVYPLPRTSEVLDTLGRAKYFSKLDLKSGYWQIAMEPSDRHKTAFVTRQGLFEFLVMPFGLTTAPATFQRLMDSLLGDLLWKKVMVYLDDIIVFTETWEEHMVVLDEVFTRLRAAGLKASPAKCELGMEQLLYLGHIVTREGVLPDPQNVQAILAATPPQDVSELRRFLGMCTYYDEQPAEEPWYCEQCRDTRDSLDITEDTNTLNFVRGDPVNASARERARVRARAQRYYWEAGRLHHKASRKPVPSVAERVAIIQDTHELGHFGVARTA